jgi:phosphate transport system protein
VAQVARGRYPNAAIDPALTGVFTEMNEAARRVAQRTTQVLSSHDLTEAEGIERDDDLLDSLHEETFRVLLSPSWSGTAQQTVDVTLLGRYYERFGDHAVSVARRIVYLVTGEFAGDTTGTR